jgi:hypothetical protein
LWAALEAAANDERSPFETLNDEEFNRAGELIEALTKSSAFKRYSAGRSPGKEKGQRDLLNFLGENFCPFCASDQLLPACEKCGYNTGPCPSCGCPQCVAEESPEKWPRKLRIGFEFIRDLKDSFEPEHYVGRFFYKGPSVVVDDVADATSKTNVKCQWDNLGLSYVVYPRL